MHEYGRTGFEGLDAIGAVSLDAQAADVWQRSPFYRMLETGASLLRRQLGLETVDEFSLLPEWYEAGLTEYVAVLTRFAAEGVIGEMDALYSSWGTKAATGFDEDQLIALERIVPYLALAIKSVSLVRMTRTLMETYLGRDAGQRVLRGRIVRGIAERIDAVVWFSDLRGFTRITDTEPEQVISLLNDYSDVIVSTIQEHGGDVLKLIGDGTLAIFTAENRTQACSAALAAAIAARQGVAELNKRRSAQEKPVTDMYLGLHVGEVFFGNVGSRERLDFTVLGPAVNEASRIAAMCRSVDQPILLSAAFADVGETKHPPPFSGTICVAWRVTTTGVIHDRFGSVIVLVIALGWMRPFRTSDARSPPAWVATLDLPPTHHIRTLSWLRSSHDRCESV